MEVSENGGTPNHPKLDRSSIETHDFGGSPSLGKPQMWQETIGLTHPTEVFLPVLLSTTDRFSLSTMG